MHARAYLSLGVLSVRASAGNHVFQIVGELVCCFQPGGHL